jgi:hypothetical protein
MKESKMIKMAKEIDTNDLMHIIEMHMQINGLDVLNTSVTGKDGDLLMVGQLVRFEN